ncbi:MAG: DUF3667 domain-containing protein [Sphingobacteriales bacterium]|nr:MAG: DUF3667 domain-containing protein [Sphingobacteriales bacterium]
MKFGFRKARAIAPEVQLPEQSVDGHRHPQNCLNCETALAGNYCHQCGQSAHTHRMSFKHFLLHDFVHGVWHLDKGFPATLKKAFVRPGEEIRSYLAGKRVGWFSILTMILLLYAVVNYFTTKYDYAEESKQSRIVFEFIAHNSKWLLLALAFVCSWSSYLIFRRSKLNLSEHTIVNCFFLVGILAINGVYSAIPFEPDGWLMAIIPVLR